MQKWNLFLLPTILMIGYSGCISKQVGKFSNLRPDVSALARSTRISAKLLTYCSKDAQPEIGDFRNICEPEPQKHVLRPPCKSINKLGGAMKCPYCGDYNKGANPQNERSCDVCGETVDSRMDLENMISAEISKPWSYF